MPVAKPHPVSDNADGIMPWARCPSTHCERAKECRSPNNCSGTGVPAAIRAQRAYRARQAGMRARSAKMEAALNQIANSPDWATALGMRLVAQEGLK